jgi:Arc/MetJ-type ribon-helix-helix transcriptional regulator
VFATRFGNAILRGTNRTVEPDGDLAGGRESARNLGWLYLQDILTGMAKVLISVPDDLLERIDREVRARGSNRSAFLRDAAQRELGWPDPGALAAALQRGRAALAAAGAFESAQLIGRDRQARDAADRRRR